MRSNVISKVLGKGLTCRHILVQQPRFPKESNN